MKHLARIEAIGPFLAYADYTDVKMIEGDVSLQSFVASMLSYCPWWLIWLYHIRAVVARLLGLVDQEQLDMPIALEADSVPLLPGETAAFFTVRAAEKDKYWIAETPEDKHLRAYFCVEAETLDDNRKRFHVVTIVHHKHWTGPVYFNLIRPFHHLVVYSMMRAGVRKNKV
ncbi:DUF2867 domain-containing protein [Thermodesulfobacteriota bacterium]